MLEAKFGDNPWDGLEFPLLIVKISSAIFNFSPIDSPSKTMKKNLFHLKSPFRSRDIQIFPLPFNTFNIQKDK